MLLSKAGPLGTTVKPDSARDIDGFRREDAAETSDSTVAIDALAVLKLILAALDASLRS